MSRVIYMTNPKPKFSVLDIMHNQLNYNNFMNEDPGAFTTEFAVKGRKNPTDSKLPDNTTTKRCLKHMGP